MAAGEATLAGFAEQADELLSLVDGHELWNMSRIAQYTGLAGSTLSAYYTRVQMPEPALAYGRTKLWEPDVIRAWRPQ